MNPLERRIEALERAALPQDDSCGLTDEEVNQRIEAITRQLLKEGSLVETAEGIEVGEHIPRWQDREFVSRLAELLTKAKQRQCCKEDPSTPFGRSGSRLRSNREPVAGIEPATN